MIEERNQDLYPQAIETVEEILQEVIREVPEVPAFTRDDLKCIYIKMVINHWIAIGWATEKERKRLVTAYREILKDSDND